mgnify:CR=1 FL=1
MKSMFLGASILALAIAAPAFAVEGEPIILNPGPTMATTPTECTGATNNCSVVDQSGNGQDATVTQDGANDVSSITQAAADNDAQVNQTGIVGSLSNVTQSGNIAGNGSIAVVTQSDTGLNIAPDRFANTSVVEQSNGGNEA